MYHIKRDCHKNKNFENKIAIDLVNDDLFSKYKTKQIYFVDEYNSIYDYDCESKEFILKYNKRLNKSIWHQKWQGYFDKSINEVKIGDNKSDVCINNLCLEFQHSFIKKQDVNIRTDNYKKHGKNTIWVLDFTNTVHLMNDKKIFVVINNCIKIENKKSFLNQFSDLDYCFLDYNKKIIKIYPAILNASNEYFKVDGYVDKKEFIKLLKTGNINSFSNYKVLEREFLGKITLLQQGAGSGKTWKIVNYINDYFPEQGKNNFVYLSKTHSAKKNIYDEFISQIKNSSLNNIECNVNEIKPQNGKYYEIMCKNKKYECDIKIIIATIDSFVYNLCGPKNVESEFIKNYFCDIINRTNVIEQDKFKHSKITSNTMVIMDESQDMDAVYLRFMDKILSVIPCDFYLIGDKLQSIYNEENLYTYIIREYKNKTTKNNIEYICGENHCRRFHNKKLKDFVNDVIPFKKYELEEISKIGKEGNTEFISEDPVFMNLQDDYSRKIESNGIIDIHMIDEDAMNRDINIIIGHLNTLCCEEQLLPHEVLFIFPFLKENVIANELLIHIDHFWKCKFKDSAYSNEILNSSDEKKWKINFYKNIMQKNIATNFCQLHQSVCGRPIDLTESEFKTRLLSIHASKGLTSKFVFLIGMNKRSLNKYSKGRQNLLYHSLIHVAITRQEEKLYVGSSDLFNNSKMDNLINIQYVKKYVDCDTFIDNMMINDNAVKNIHEEYLSRNIDYVENKKKRMNIQENEDLIDFNDHTFRYKLLEHKLITLSMMNNNILQLIAKYYNLDFTVNILNLCDFKKSRSIIVNYLKSWGNKQKVEELKNKITIPILEYNTEFGNLSAIMKKILEKLQKKIFRKDKTVDVQRIRELKCPMELVILGYFYEFMNNPYKCPNVYDVYKVIEYWGKCFVNDKTHESYNCICKDVFRSLNSDHKNKIYKYYKCLEDIGKKFKLLNINNTKVKYKQFVPFKDKYDHKTEYIILYNVFFLRYISDDKETIIVPSNNLTIMEYDKLMFNIFIKKCLLNFNCEKQYEFILFAIDDEPIKINFELSNKEINEMSDLMSNFILKLLKNYNFIVVEYFFNKLNTDDFAHDDEDKCDNNCRQICNDKKINDKRFEKFIDDEDLNELKCFSICKIKNILSNLFHYVNGKKIKSCNFYNRMPEYIRPFFENVNTAFSRKILKNIKNIEDIKIKFTESMDSKIDAIGNIFK